MSNKKFLPSHPKIIKKIANTNDFSKFKYLSSQVQSSTISENLEQNQQLVKDIIDAKKKDLLNIKAQLQRITDKNDQFQSAISTSDFQTQKKQILEQIEKAHIQQQQLMMKIKNCEKVEETTTSQQYYLWQKKKKVDEFNQKLNTVIMQNKNASKELYELRQQCKNKVKEQKQQIQAIINQIQITQNSFGNDDSTSQIQVVDLQSLRNVKQQYEALTATVKILRQNTEILSSQLQDGMQSIQLSLRKQFQNSKSSLIRQLQNLKRDIQNLQPPSPQKIKLISPSQAINQYNHALSQITDLLSPQEAEQAARMIKPFDWGSLRWQQYLESDQKDKVDYQQKFTRLSKQHEELQKKILKMDAQIQMSITENVKANQQNMQIQSAMNKLVKILQMAKK